MTIDEIRLQAKQLVAKVCGLRVEQIGDHDPLRKWADSLALIEILVEAERQFDLRTLEDEDGERLFADLQTVEDLTQLLHTLITPAVAA
jgi:acyl carrier protein